jgi:ATP-dependent protease ClpP protease subunit/regulator of replication initiation timing
VAFFGKPFKIAIAPIISVIWVMEATINITGVIGAVPISDSEKGNPLPRYTFTNLASDIKEAREAGATAFRFIFDSIGGYVNEAFLMSSYIETLPERTIAVALNVFSAANIPYFACDARDCETNGVFMLHQSWGDFQGNSNELRSYASQLDKEDDRMASYIVSRTGLDFEAVKGLMGTDRYIEKKEAIRLGLLNEAQSFKIAALYTKQQTKMAEKSKAQQVLDSIKALISGTPKALNISLKDGSSISVETEDGEIEGKPTNAPAGTHALEDGRSITVADGVVKSVQEGSKAPADDEGEKMRQELAEAKQKLADMEQEKEKMHAEAMALKVENESLATQFGQVFDHLKAMKSNGQPINNLPIFSQQQHNQPKAGDASESEKAAEAMLKAKREAYAQKKAK